MKGENPSLYAALLISLLGNILLCGQTGYWTRVGILTAPACALLLAGAAGLFAHAWRRCEGPALRALFFLLLTASSALELLRLWQLFTAAYPQATTLFGICLTVLVPVIYLRRVSSIAQTANVLLCLLIIGCGVVVCSIAPQLRVTNLQFAGWNTANTTAALRAQLVLYPELLLPALWPDPDKRGGHTVLRLSGTAALFGVGAHLLLELFFGAAMPARSNPVQAVAQSGTLSIFNRIEWIQLILWSMLVSLKLALYLYAMVRLLGGKTCKAENNAVGLDRFPLYFAGILFLCALGRRLDLVGAILWRDRLTWCLAIVVMIGGGCQWLFRKKFLPA